MRETIAALGLGILILLAIVGVFSVGYISGHENGWCEAKNGHVVASHKDNYCLIQGQMVSIPRHR